MAVIVTVWESATDFDVTGKVAVAEPPASLTDPGTDASFVFELAKATLIPLGGAGPVKVTEPITGTLEPPTIVDGAIDKSCRDAG